jgi:hypothetical protein
MTAKTMHPLAMQITNPIAPAPGASVRHVNGTFNRN